jgi:hypothetical protein
MNDGSTKRLSKSHWIKGDYSVLASLNPRRLAVNSVAITLTAES